MSAPTHPQSGAQAHDAAALAALDAQHARFDAVLEALVDLAPHLQGQGPDEGARATAARVLALFDDEAAAHREVEERLVLPLLRRQGGEAGVALATRLETEHDLIARAWSQCRPALADLATAGLWPAEAAAVEFERWRDFAALASAHMLAEQGAALPSVHALLKGSTAR